jgi:toxin ParE1/3/4
MKVRWARTAVRDLGALDSYIGEQQPAAADALVDAIQAGAGMLEQYPNLGRPGRVAGTRELIVAPFVIVYRVRKTVVEIAAVIHGARKWPESI